MHVNVLFIISEHCSYVICHFKFSSSLQSDGFWLAVSVFIVNEFELLNSLTSFCVKGEQVVTFVHSGVKTQLTLIIGHKSSAVYTAEIRWAPQDRPYTAINAHMQTHIDSPELLHAVWSPVFSSAGLRQRVGLAAEGEVSNPSSSTAMCIHCRLPSVEFLLWPVSQKVPPFLHAHLHTCLSSHTDK